MDKLQALLANIEGRLEAHELALQAVIGCVVRSISDAERQRLIHDLEHLPSKVDRYVDQDSPSEHVFITELSRAMSTFARRARSESSRDSP